MKKILSLGLATVMFFAMTLCVSAETITPERIIEGEVNNNAVVGGQWLESSTFLPVSSGIGDVYVDGSNANGMTAILHHVNPDYNIVATKIAEKNGANVVDAFTVRLPALVFNARVVFNVKEGYTVPQNLTAIATSGDSFTVLPIERISDSQYAITIESTQRSIFVLDGGSYAPGSVITYSDVFYNN